MWMAKYEFFWTAEVRGISNLPPYHHRVLCSLIQFSNECLTYKLLANYYASGCGLLSDSICHMRAAWQPDQRAICANYWKTALKNSYIFIYKHCQGLQWQNKLIIEWLEFTKSSGCGYAASSLTLEIKWILLEFASVFPVETEMRTTLWS